MTVSLTERFESSLRSDELLPGVGNSVVVAVSGGLDSTCLAYLLSECCAPSGPRLVLAHVQHGVRPEEADVELRSVERMAAVLGLELRVGRLEVPEDLRIEVGLEGAARTVRLKWLREVASDVGAAHIFLGHHRDDQLETILLRRAEGLDAAQAAGMAPRRGPFCRPLLAVSRQELRKLAEDRQWSWVEDPSNEDERFRRNQLRHTEIPKLRAHDPDWEQRVLGQGKAARLLADSLTTRARTRFSRQLALAGLKKIRLEREFLKEAPQAERIWLFQRLCRPRLEGGRGPGRKVLLQLSRAIDEDKETRLFDLGAGWTARLESVWIVLRGGGLPLELEGPASQASRSLRMGEQISWSPGVHLGMTSLSGVEARRLLGPGGSVGCGVFFALFDADEVGAELSVVSCDSGRRFQPFGMSGTRSVRDLLAESGVPRAERSSFPLVIDANGKPLWLPGIRASSEASLRPHSDRAVMLYTVAAFGYDLAALEMES